MRLTDLEWPIVLVFACIVLFWAFIRPGAIRDYDDRQLPRKLMARIFVVAIYVLSYLILVGALHTGGAVFHAKMAGVAGMTAFGAAAEWLSANLVARVATQQAPYTAFAVLASMMGLAPFRELERRFIIWSHGGSHLHGHTDILSRHLATCRYVPSDSERRRSVAGLEAFNVFLTNSDTSGIKLPSVEHWRKVNVLIRLLREWNSGGTRALSRKEMRQLEEIAKAHERKTRLALGIVSLMSRGGNSGEAIGRVQDLLAGARHGDSNAMAMAEAKIGAMLGEAAGSQLDQPVRIAPGQLDKYLALVNDYFEEEYAILVGQLAQLAAKSVVLAGDASPSRLEDLKTVGFERLGRIDPIGVDGILKVFLYVGIGGFLVFYLLRYRTVRQELLAAGVDFELVSKASFGMLTMFAVISLIMAIAALIGAMVGSRDRVAMDGQLPASHVLGAGFAAVGAFFLVHWAQLTYGQDGAMQHMRQARIQQQERLAQRQRAQANSVAPLPSQQSARATPETPRQPVPTKHEASIKLSQLAPWSVLPFAITVGICLLARVPAWPAPVPIKRHRWRRIAWERGIDGLIFALLMAAATWTAREIIEVLDLWPKGMPRNQIKTLQFYLPTVVFGFVIGATVVRLVRTTAHSRIVENGALASQPAPAPAPPARPLGPIVTTAQ